MEGLHINSSSLHVNTKRHVQRKQSHDLTGSFEHSKQSILSSMDKFIRTVQSMGSTVLVPSRLHDMRLRPRLPDCQITLLANRAASGHRPHHRIGSHGATGRLNKTKPLHSASDSTTRSTTKSTSSSSHHKLHSHFHTSHYHHSLSHNRHTPDYHRSSAYHRLHSSTHSTCNSTADKLNHDPAELPSVLMNADLYSFYSMLHDIKAQLLWGPASGQSTISTNCNQSNARFQLEKSALHQLNSTMASRNLNSSDKPSLTKLSDPHAGLLEVNRAESSCSSGRSSSYASSKTSSTHNSMTNLSYIAKCSSPTTSTANPHSVSLNSLSPVTTRSMPSPQTSIEDLPSSSNPRTPTDTKANSSIKVRLMRDSSQEDVNDSAVSSSSSVVDSSSSVDGSSSSGKLVDSPLSKTPQSDSDLELELESDSILTDRTTEPNTDQAQLLASAFRHHLQALHTILDQLTHSAEYLSKNYELDLDE